MSDSSIVKKLFCDISRSFKNVNGHLTHEGNWCPSGLISSLVADVTNQEFIHQNSVKVQLVTNSLGAMTVKFFPVRGSVFFGQSFPLFLRA